MNDSTASRTIATLSNRCCQPVRTNKSLVPVSLLAAGVARIEISGGSFAIFLDRPVALALLAIPVIVIGFLLFRPRSLDKLRESDID